MNVNGKKIPISCSNAGRGIEENGRRGEFNYDIFIHCKNLCKCHNVPLPEQ
jgi:hypothetical protein